jgi:hypothetical protein
VDDKRQNQVDDLRHVSVARGGGVMLMDLHGNVILRDPAEDGSQFDTPLCVGEEEANDGGARTHPEELEMEG